MKEAQKRAARAAAHYSKEAQAFLDGLTMKTERDAYVAAYNRVVEASKLAERTAGIGGATDTVINIGYKLAHDAGVRAVEGRRQKSERDAKAKRDARAAKKPVGTTGQLTELSPEETAAINAIPGTDPIVANA